jgi:cell division protease FtsH
LSGNFVRQRLRPIAAILLGLIALVGSTTLAHSQPAMPKRLMPYRDFVQQVETDKINRIALSRDRTKATVIQDGQSIEVNLPPDSGLIDLLTRNNVDITVQSSSEQSFWVRSIISLVVPVVLMSGLLLVVILVTVILTKNFMQR